MGQTILTNNLDGVGFEFGGDLRIGAPKQPNRSAVRADILISVTNFLFSYPLFRPKISRIEKKYSLVLFQLPAMKAEKIWRVAGVTAGVVPTATSPKWPNSLSAQN